MDKAKVLAITALGVMAFDVLVNFSVAMMNTAMDVTIFVIVALMMVAMRKKS